MASINEWKLYLCVDSFTSSYSNVLDDFLRAWANFEMHMILLDVSNWHILGSMKNSFFSSNLEIYSIKKNEITSDKESKIK